jgi:hypothetical protein
MAYVFSCSHFLHLVLSDRPVLYVFYDVYTFLLWNSRLSLQELAIGLCAELVQFSSKFQYLHADLFEHYIPVKHVGPFLEE